MSSRCALRREFLLEKRACPILGLKPKWNFVNRWTQERKGSTEHFLQEAHHVPWLLRNLAVEFAPRGKTWLWLFDRNSGKVQKTPRNVERRKGWKHCKESILILTMKQVLFVNPTCVCFDLACSDLAPRALSPTKMNQKCSKDPKSILILTMRLLYTYFWKTLPVGALIWLVPIWLIWAQIARPVRFWHLVKNLTPRHLCENPNSLVRQETTSCPPTHTSHPTSIHLVSPPSLSYKDGGLSLAWKPEQQRGKKPSWSPETRSTQHFTPWPPLEEMCRGSREHFGLRCLLAFDSCALFQWWADETTNLLKWMCFFEDFTLPNEKWTPQAEWFWSTRTGTNSSPNKL